MRASGTTSELPDDIDALKTIIGEKTAQLRDDMETRVAVLEEQLRLAAHKRFGANSEKADPAQLGLFNEAESLSRASAADNAATSDATITVPEHTRAKGGRKPFPADLPRQRVEHECPDSDNLCPCGSGPARPRIGEVITEQADMEPAKIKIIQNVRFKYGSCHVCTGVFPEASERSTLPVTAEDATQTSAGPSLPATPAAPRAVVLPEARAVIVAPMRLLPIYCTRLLPAARESVEPMAAMTAPAWAAAQQQSIRSTTLRPATSFPRRAYGTAQRWRPLCRAVLFAA